MHYLSSDVGGTFTDLVLLDTLTGNVFLDKVPSGRRGSAESVCKGIERIVRKAGIQKSEIRLFVHGFTVGTTPS